MEVGGRGRAYTYRYTVTTRMTCIKMGCDESHFNVSLIVTDKVTKQSPLKGHSFTRSAPSERFGYQYDCGSSLAPKHARKHEAHPPRVKKEFCFDSKKKKKKNLSWR